MIVNVSNNIVDSSPFQKKVFEIDSSQDYRALNDDLFARAIRELQDWSSDDNRYPLEFSPPVQVIDFFSGCGGMSLGFAAFSRVTPIFEVIGGVDIDSDALRTFEENLGAPGIKLDIRDLVDDDEALVDLLSQMPGYRQDRPTVAIGCAPCQGFTSHRKRHWNQDDHRNTLVGVFADVAVRLDPACIVMENVPEMLSNKYWNHFEDANAILRRNGYQVSQAIYNAASFSVPQERFRALVMGMRKPFLLPKPQTINPAEFSTVRDAIGHLPPVEAGQITPDDPLHKSAKHRPSTIDTIRSIPKDGGSRPPGIGPACLDRVKGFYDVYGRLAWNKPAITVTHYARNPASGRFVHPEQDRGLTIREAALLQGFPYGYRFHGSFDSVFKQIGEAVAPPFALGVATNCAIELVSTPPSEEQKSLAIESISEPVSSSFSSVIAGLKHNRNKV